ncbi:hypothetical protein ACJMK2_007328 [Sinanodonta woodiana]|uniref:G-protein coupled receptors family 2 profile 2 domain-containing protein n=1 Tax=Sinanodonta woodiana TaxID=1069815 RepID=A0ABD3VJB1_SINWO
MRRSYQTTVLICFQLKTFFNLSMSSRNWRLLAVLFIWLLWDFTSLAQINESPSDTPAVDATTSMLSNDRFDTILFVSTPSTNLDSPFNTTIKEISNSISPDNEALFSKVTTAFNSSGSLSSVKSTATAEIVGRDTSSFIGPSSVSTFIVAEMKPNVIVKGKGELLPRDPIGKELDLSANESSNNDKIFTSQESSNTYMYIPEGDLFASQTVDTTNATRNMHRLTMMYALTCGVHHLCDPDRLHLPISRNISNVYFNNCPPCQCDDKCVNFGDCCPDVEVIRAIQTDRIYHCQNTYLERGFFLMSTCAYTYKENATVKDHCENAALHSDDPLVFMPVTSNISGHSYRNRYCAECNYDLTSTDGWSLSSDCPNPMNPNEFSSVQEVISYLQSVCGSILYQPKGWMKPRPCQIFESIQKPPLYEPIESCNKTGLWKIYNSDVDWACRNFHLPIFDDVNKFQYKNVFCYHCNRGQKVKVTKNTVVACKAKFDMQPSNVHEWGCKNLLRYFNTKTGYKNGFCCMCSTENSSDCSLLNSLQVSFDLGIPEVKVFRLSPTFKGGWNSYKYIFDFTSSINDRLKDDSISSRCKRNEFYDTVKGECRTIQCSGGRQLSMNTCVPIINSGIYVGFNVSNTYLVSISAKVTNSNWKNVARTFFEGMQRFLYSMIPPENLMFLSLEAWTKVFLCNNKKTNQLIQDCLDDSCRPMVILGVAFDIIVTAKADRRLTEDHLISSLFQNFSISLNETRLNFVPMTKSILERKTDIEKEFEKTNVSDTSKCLEEFSYKMKFDSVLRYLSVNAFNVVFAALKKTISCPYVTLVKDEYEIDNRSGFLRVKAVDVLLTRNEYEIQENETAAICIDSYLHDALQQTLPSDDKQILSIFTIFSWICTILSLLCLIITFTTYCIFEKLRTLPGKNNMILVSVLFLSQSLLFFGLNQTENRIGCVAIGIAIHYFWIATFCGMNICSFHMFRVFSGLFRTQTGPKDEETLLLYYVNYIFGIPILVTGVTILVEMISTKGESLGYGPDACFLSTPPSIGLYFVLPILILIVMNFVYFIIATLRIRWTPHVRSSNDGRDFFIYLKLFSITGVTWILQIVDAQFQVIAVSFIATAINACQGIFIFLSFVCNRRVRRLYEQLLCHRQSRLSSGTWTPSAFRNRTKSSSLTTSTEFSMSTSTASTDTKF